MWIATTILNLIIGIQPIQEIVVEKGSASFSLAAPSGVFTSHGTYAITTNEQHKKIVGSLTSPLPPQVQLTIHLEAPKGAKSLGPMTLSEGEKNLVTEVGPVAQKALRITYVLSCKTPLPSDTYTNCIRLTLTD
ncbi:MAG: hypothetical protein FJZ58_01190 [Chlamydiae bacterium]|nr:hypothetical protein [Chlamydiota bacterium]